MAVDVTWSASSSESWGGGKNTATLKKYGRVAKITVSGDYSNVDVELTKTELLELAATAQALAAGMED